jgi:hypothetical protein
MAGAGSLARAGRGLVERRIESRLDLARIEHGRGHHHVIAGAAGHQLGLFLFADVDVVHDLVELILIYLRTLFCIFVEGIAHRALFRPFHALLHELVVGLLFHPGTIAGDGRFVNSVVALGIGYVVVHGLDGLAIHADYRRRGAVPPR